MSNNNQAGKGDKPRPVKKKVYDINYEDIVWKQNANPNSVTKKGRTTYKY